MVFLRYWDSSSAIIDFFARDALMYNLPPRDTSRTTLARLNPIDSRPGPRFFTTFFFLFHKERDTKGRNAGADSRRRNSSSHRDDRGERTAGGYNGDCPRGKCGLMTRINPFVSPPSVEIHGVLALRRSETRWSCSRAILVSRGPLGLTL